MRDTSSRKRCSYNYEYFVGVGHVHNYIYRKLHDIRTVNIRNYLHWKFYNFVNLRGNVTIFCRLHPRSRVCSLPLKLYSYLYSHSYSLLSRYPFSVMSRHAKTRIPLPLPHRTRRGPCLPDNVVFILRRACSTIFQRFVSCS